MSAFNVEQTRELRDIKGCKLLATKDFDNKLL